MKTFMLRASLLALMSIAPGTAFACATCGCSLSADAAMGYSAVAGWRINLEYDFIDQNQLRAGYSPIAPSRVAGINNAGGDQEVERGTINRYYTTGVTYSPNANWSATVLVPYINRTHETYGSATSDQLSPDNTSGAHSTGLGDIKLIGSFQGILPQHNLGLQLGIKVPSGRYGGNSGQAGAPTVGRDPVSFYNGPAAGSALDTSLNPGTGSTDLIVGAYYHQAVSQNFDAFVNTQIQFVLAHNLDLPGSDFRPGGSENLSLGIRYERNPRWIPQMQINVTHKSPDQGALADNTDTAGTVVYLSPGLTFALLKQVHAFAFVQKPVFSKLNGYQVFPHWTESLGLSYAF